MRKAADNRRYNATYRAKKRAAVKADPSILDGKHGKVSSYTVYECRCDDCTLVMINALERYKKYGTTVVR